MGRMRSVVLFCVEEEKEVIWGRMEVGKQKMGLPEIPGCEELKENFYSYDRGNSLLHDTEII
jgi:hypothetical protein